MGKRIIIWDNDGTVTGSKDPNDVTEEKVILPNVATVMNYPNIVNIICSGCATPESESQNFDPDKIIIRFRNLMEKLPISFAVFSPKIGGVECYVAYNDRVIKAHEDPKYQHLIGKFKKPGIGMLAVIMDIIKTQYKDYAITMVGDSWHDKEAARSIGINFIDAQDIHKGEIVCKSFL